jgi:hypothetical protein
MRVARQSRFHRILGSGTSLICFFWSHRMSSRSLLALAGASFSFPALAHDGHCLLGSHWHATDALGFVAGGVLIALAVWLSKK